MPRSFTVDLDELQDKIDEMSRFEATIEQSLEHLDQVIARLHLTWTGAAADAQREAHQRWVEGMRTMRAGLAEIRAAGERGHANYSAAIQANQKMWSQVR